MRAKTRKILGVGGFESATGTKALQSKKKENEGC